ncbi:EAL domain-containing protein [Isoptericola sp. b441]|uniref:EAL domain-containing protein n=1 Tax=Actinotalea lenta TaxID=3064654 RepID=A0ABT9DBA1_9CELL|nr:EAL domain-containing protein [Isoptericola sp. b441]MDO8107781.1 EAL domain-containing protein [Isoptericola sp. b441]
MSGSVPTWSIAIQCTVAGAVVGLVALQAVWLSASRALRPGAPGRLTAGWTLAWSSALAAATLVTALTGLVGDAAVVDSVVGDGLAAARMVALGASVTLALPVVRTLTAGPGVRTGMLALSTWYVVAAALWFTTDLPVRSVDTVHLVPLVVVAGYVGLATRQLRMSARGVALALAGSSSALLLAASCLPAAPPAGDLLAGLWAVPLVAGLHGVAARRVTDLRASDTRREVLRSTLATVAERAWESRTTADLLGLACDAAQEALDVEVTAALRLVGPERFEAELACDRTLDDDARAFLADLARVVQAAAERLVLSDRLRRYAYVDALTGLPTRTALDEHLAATMSAGRRPALMLVDVEGLKRVNERHGHAGGDRVLQHVAQHLRAVLGAGAFVARTGGDEFAAVPAGEPTADDLRSLGSHLRSSLSVPPGITVRPRLTVGLAPASGGGPAELQRHADLAMTEARSTHAGVVYFDARLQEREASRAALVEDLERAIAGGRILAHFQPVADATTLQVLGVEALARWQDGDTLRAPAGWLPLAEETGLIVEIGRQMFAAARAGMERFGLPVAVNVSPRQLDEPDVLRTIEAGWGPDAWDMLTIEVTESALVHDEQHARDTLTQLAARGARIALDDFGTGYNSLARLGTLPLHVLKIDKSLVDEVATPEGVAVLRAIVALAEAHGLEVVAEGVERRSQLTALLGIGIGVVQGNLVGRPRADGPDRTSAAPSQRVRLPARSVAPA